VAVLNGESGRARGLMAAGRRSLLIVAVSGLAACGSGRNVDHTIVVCGKVLARYNRSGAPLYVLPLPVGTSANPMLSNDGTPLFIRVAPGCTHGAAVSITPSGLVSIGARVNGHDGNPVALALTGRQAGTAVLTANVGGHLVGRIELVVLDPNQPSPPESSQAHG